jgi:predicted homoserine dehydrogenase-like protein
MIAQDLQKLAAEGCPIQVGVSGAGWIGSGFVQQVAQMQGMRVPVLADPDTRLAHAAFVASGVPAEQIVETDHPGRAQDAVRRGQRVVTGSYALAAQLEAVDIVADVTPYPASGAETAWSCIQYGKDVVMVNIEADVTVGRILKQKARQAGILYTVSSGDEPGCLMELWDFVTTLGFEPVVIGKGKNNPLNPKATPDSVAESARRAAKDPYQVASYVDGSKTMFEMACAANATGCPPQQRGMLGPDADLISVSQIFALQQDGGLVEKPGVVDFVQGGAMAGGVFITVRVADPRLRADLEYLKVGKGYYYTFFRPYHLWFIEAPISVARAYLYRQTTLVSLDQPTAEVLTLAKRDLQPGETLDTFGGYTFSGVIDTAAAAAAANALPVGLAPGAVVTSSLAAGQVITWEDVQLDETQTVVRLRREQDQIITLVS